MSQQRCVKIELLFIRTHEYERNPMGLPGGGGGIGTTTTMLVAAIIPLCVFGWLVYFAASAF